MADRHIVRRNNAPKHAKILMDDAVVKRMLANPKILAAFPFMLAAANRKNAKPQQAGCGGCGRNKQRANSPDINSLKMVIDRLPPAKKVILKDILSVGKVVIRYTDQARQRVVSTF
jgi:hypothetical protein